jgi:hypothetical protein
MPADDGWWWQLLLPVEQVILELQFTRLGKTPKAAAANAVLFAVIVDWLVAHVPLVPRK